MKFLKNLYGLFGKILFASKIILKVSRVKFAERIWGKFWRYFGKVFEEFLERFEKIFLRFCEKFTKMWRLLKKYLEELLEVDTEQIIRTIF